MAGNLLAWFFRRQPLQQWSQQCLSHLSASCGVLSPTILINVFSIRCTLDVHSYWRCEKDDLGSGRKVQDREHFYLWSQALSQLRERLLVSEASFFYFTTLVQSAVTSLIVWVTQALLQSNKGQLLILCSSFNRFYPTSPLPTGNDTGIDILVARPEVQRVSYNRYDLSYYAHYSSLLLRDASNWAGSLIWLCIPVWVYVIQSIRPSSGCFYGYL